MSKIRIRSLSLEDYKSFGCVASCFIVSQIEFLSKACGKKEERSPWYDIDKPYACGIYRSVDGWVKDLPMYSKKTFQRAFAHLIDLGVLHISNEPGHGHQHKRWFALDKDKLEALREQNKESELDVNYTEEGSYVSHLLKSVGSECPHNVVNLSGQNDLTVGSKCPHTLAYTYILHTYIQTKIEELSKKHNPNNQKSVLNFPVAWELYNKATNIASPDKKRQLKKWGNLPNSDKSNFIPRLYDYLLERYLEKGFEICCEPQSTYNLHFSNFLNKHVLQDEPVYDKEHFDGKIEHFERGKIKGNASRPQKQTSTSRLMSIDAEYQQRIANNGGIDPLANS